MIKNIIRRNVLHLFRKYILNADYNGSDNNIIPYVIDKGSAIDIDDYQDWIIAEKLFKINLTNEKTKFNLCKSEIHKLIPGAHTYSKGDDQFSENAPAAISYGKGSYVWDIDGNKFLDCSMGLSSVSLGHAHKPVIDAVKKEIDLGVNFQRPSYIEHEMAKVFLSLIPKHGMIKFTKNGSTATSAAVKLARAKTGRKLIAFPSDHPLFSYDDWFIKNTV